MATAKLETRLGRLEAAAGGSEDEPPCPECGWPHGGDDGGDATYEVVFLDEDEDPDEPAFCETCGERILEIVFDDDLEHRRRLRGSRG